jgi:hypothetical protein
MHTWLFARVLCNAITNILIITLSRTVVLVQMAWNKNVRKFGCIHTQKRVARLMIITNIYRVHRVIMSWLRSRLSCSLKDVMTVVIFIMTLPLNDFIIIMIIIIHHMHIHHKLHSNSWHTPTVIYHSRSVFLIWRKWANNFSLDILR